MNDPPREFLDPTPAPTEWFAGQVEPLRGRLARYLGAMLPSRSDVEDLVQMTLLTAWQQRDRFETGREVFPWLVGIARNHVRHHCRTHARATALAPDVIEALSDRLLAREEASNLRLEALDQCLNRLPAEQRELLTGFYRAECSVREFAATRGVSLEGLYKSLQRIRAALLQCITARLAGEDARG